jgi:hypothetical protein
MNSLNDKTSISLFAIFGALPVTAGFIFWLSSVAFSANNAENKIKELEQKQEQINGLLISIKEDLTLVKYKLDIKGGENGISK